jgi:hypothetical protein
MRIVIELRKGEEPEVVLNQLYKHTQLQDTFSIIMLALVENVPKVLNLARSSVTTSITARKSSAGARNTCSTKPKRAPTSSKVAESDRRHRRGHQQIIRASDDADDARTG